MLEKDLSKKKRVKKENPSQLSLFGRLDDKQTRTLAALIKSEQPGSDWKGYKFVPAGTVLDVTLEAFRRGSNVPLEIPMYIVLHYISANLLQRGVLIDFESQLTRPDIWTVILAESGAGKTYTQNQIENAFGAGTARFPECASAAKFVEELSKHNGSLWVRDEFAQLLRAIETAGSPLAELKDILLRVYDGNTIERNTKKESFVIDNPGLTVLGTTVLSTFFNHMSEESMLDGFAQRFGFVRALSDTSRPWSSKDHAIWTVAKHKAELEKSWGALWEQTIHPVYKFSSGALEAYRNAYESLYAEGDQESFFRRVLFRAVKYSLLYHILDPNDDSDTIHAQDMAWAIRLAQSQLDDMRTLILARNGGELSQIIDKARALKVKLGRMPKAYELAQNIRALKSTAEAKQLLSILGD